MNVLDIKELTVEQKIGQLLVARGYLDQEDKEFVYEMLRKKSVGGVQVKYFEGCEEEIKNIKEAADYPVLICADMEKGFPGSEYQIPGLLSLAATGNEELAYQVGAVTAIEAKRCGHNTVWGPVVDLFMENGIGVTRKMGLDAKAVAKMTTAIIRGYHDNGMFATAKHWIAGRDIKVDGHMVAPVSNLPEQDVLETDVIPYLDAMKNADLYGVMTSHVLHKNIDPVYVGTLSEKKISILRNLGFDGLVTTDSFAMMAVLQKYSEEECYGLAIKAGNDMVLPNYRKSFKTSYEYLLNSYKKGVFTESRLNEAVARVIKAQIRTLKPASADYVSDYQKECIARIEKEGICAITNDSCSIVLQRDTKKLFVVLSENLYEGEEDNKEITDTCCIDKRNIDAIRESILRRYPDSEVVVINQFPSPTQVETACYKATLFDEVVYITYAATGSYKASEYLTEKVVNLMKSMQGKIEAVIHLGNPYAMEAVPHVPRILLSFGGGAGSVEHSMAILNGEFEPKGILPVKLKLK